MNTLSSNTPPQTKGGSEKLQQTPLDPHTYNSRLHWIGQLHDLWLNDDHWTTINQTEDCNKSQPFGPAKRGSRFHIDNRQGNILNLSKKIGEGQDSLNFTNEEEVSVFSISQWWSAKRRSCLKFHEYDRQKHAII